MNAFELDWKSVWDTGVQMGIGTAIPAFKNGGNNMVNAVATTIIWNEAATVMTCADVIGTNLNNNKKSKNNSYAYSSTRITGRVPR